MATKTVRRIAWASTTLDQASRSLWWEAPPPRGRRKELKYAFLLSSILDRDIMPCCRAEQGAMYSIWSEETRRAAQTWPWFRCWQAPASRRDSKVDDASLVDVWLVRAPAS